MNANTASHFETPEAKSRHDTTASSMVLAAMLASVLSGALVADFGTPLMVAANTAQSQGEAGHE